MRTIKRVVRTAAGQVDYTFDEQVPVGQAEAGADRREDLEAIKMLKASSDQTNVSVQQLITAANWSAQTLDGLQRRLVDVERDLALLKAKP